MTAAGNEEVHEVAGIHIIVVVTDHEQRLSVLVEVVRERLLIDHLDVEIDTQVGLDLRLDIYGGRLRQRNLAGRVAQIDRDRWEPLPPG